jgi:hypothetical protein
VGEQRKLELISDGRGKWTDASGNPLPALDGAIDMDLSVSPFTNTLPIRRLRLPKRLLKNPRFSQFITQCGLRDR